MDKLFLLGRNISYSLSPKIYNAFFRENGIDARYSLLDVEPEALKKEVKKLALDPEVKGFNVTKPYKVLIIPELSKLSESAEEVNSVNCVAKEGTLLVGFNTDRTGFVNSLSEVKNALKGQTALVLGAGGAAPAVISGLLVLGVSKVFVANRTFEKADILSERFENTEAVPLEDAESVAAGCKIIVNATTVGLHGEKSLIPERSIRKGQILYDLIYNPEETDFLKVGKRKGAFVMNGTKMLLLQARENLKIWGYAR